MSRHPLDDDASALPLEDDRPGEGRRRIALVAAGVFVVAMATMWIWMLFIYDPGNLVDELQDRSFPTEAERICAAARDDLEELPPAPNTQDPDERAEVIYEANAILASMVAQLAPLAPTEPPDAAEAVNEWLGDWRTYLGDRQRYADALREDPDARFTESPKGSRQISRAIDGYANVNRMPSCSTPGDV